MLAVGSGIWWWLRVRSGLTLFCVAAVRLFFRGRVICCETPRASFLCEAVLSLCPISLSVAGKMGLKGCVGEQEYRDGGEFRSSLPPLWETNSMFSGRIGGALMQTAWPPTFSVIFHPASCPSVAFAGS